jgi:transcriptional regulator with XRE-family HTH domain
MGKKRTKGDALKMSGFGAILDAYMISQNDLAEFLGVSKSALSRFSRKDSKYNIDLNSQIIDLRSFKLEADRKPGVFAEHENLRSELSAPATRDIRHACAKLEVQLFELEEKLTAARQKYDRAMSAHRHLINLRENYPQINPDRAAWCKQHISATAALARNNSPEVQLHLEAEIAAVRAKLGVYKGG